PGRHAGRGTAAELPDPDDRAAGLDHGHAAAIPAGHLRIDQERLEPALGAAERDEAFAATRRANHEGSRQLVGIEGYAARLAGNRIGLSPRELRFERLADLGQFGTAGDADRALGERGRRSEREARESAAHLDGHSTQPERTSGRRDGERSPEAAMGPRSQRGATPETFRRLTQDLGGDLAR